MIDKFETNTFPLMIRIFTETSQIKIFIEGKRCLPDLKQLNKNGLIQNPSKLQIHMA